MKQALNVIEIFKKKINAPSKCVQYMFKPFYVWISVNVLVRL